MDVLIHLLQSSRRPSDPSRAEQLITTPHCQRYPPNHHPHPSYLRTRLLPRSNVRLHYYPYHLLFPISHYRQKEPNLHPNLQMVKLKKDRGGHYWSFEATALCFRGNSSREHSEANLSIVPRGWRADQSWQICIDLLPFQSQSPRPSSPGCSQLKPSLSHSQTHSSLFFSGRRY